MIVALCCVLLSVHGFGGETAQGQDAFPLKDGDTWVMVGDSITAQHLHSNYIEAFCYARFPKWTFHFRNSGVGGDTVAKALARFGWDVAAWKPTVVSVEIAKKSSDTLRANLDQLTEQVLEADTNIREAAQPKSHHFIVTPVE